MADYSQALEGFTESEFTHDGTTRRVFRAGTGPAVIVIHELPGMHAGVLDFGRRLVDRGFTVVLPSLVGTPGKPFGVGYTMRSFSRACVAQEFAAFAADRTSPIVGWLRQLAAETHDECGGPGVGVVGMCFTGGFALGMMVDSRVLAPVLSQPSLPLGFSRKKRGGLNLSPEDLAAVKQRAADGACVLGLRFTADRIVRAERFERLRDELGDAFIAVEIDSGKGNPHDIKRTAHSVLTRDLVDEPGHPTRDALDRVFAFMDERLAR